jgi:hypothetical protein
MNGPRILVSSWNDGVFVIDSHSVAHELRGRSVQWLTRDPEGRPLAIVDGARVCRRDASGSWTSVVEVDAPIRCCVARGAALVLGTDDARMLRVDERGAIEPLIGFERVAGRERWYAGTAIVDGRAVGPPLGVRSLAVTCDARVLLANVHVGGIPRSTDEGRSWEPTLDIELDAHEVCAHPTDPRCVIAATAAGLCISRDAGRTWTVESRGLHADHCASVGFVGADILVGCAGDHFAPQGAVYRRRVDGEDPLEPVGRGLPEWTDGIVDTRGIASHGASAALVDRGGHLYVSLDEGRSWSRHRDGLPAPSGVLVADARAAPPPP